MDPATPPQFVPYVIQGIEDWQVAFEAAGFSNAIIGMEAPKDDPDWSPNVQTVRKLEAVVEPQHANGRRAKRTAA